MPRSWTTVLVAVVASGGIPRSSPAGVVMPGQTVIVSAADYVTPEGPVLAETVLPFSIEYGPMGGEFVEFPGTLKGTLTSTVVRDQELGTLLFLYDIDIDYEGDADASDASVLTVNGFGAFGTEVDGILDDESVVLAARTDDGSAVKLMSDDPGLGGAPRLVVRTDATEFAATGTARFFAGDELGVLTPDGWEMAFAGGTAVVPGTFQPVDASAPTPIPLPPGVWTGLLGLVTAISMRRYGGRREGVPRS